MGLRFYLTDPRPDEVTLEDVAHALSMQCRFGGHTSRFYSVAQSCVYVGERCGAWGLFSEAWRTYTPQPALAPAIMAAVAGRFGLGEAPEGLEGVRQRIFATEAAQLFDPPLETGCTAEPYPVTLDAWGPAEAERFFLRTYRELK